MPAMTISVDMNALREGRSRHSAKAMADPVSDLFQSILNLRDTEDPVARSFVEKAENANFCTVVYNACGSCDNGGEDGYLVEYFCDSEGGSTPDYEMCFGC